MGCVVMFAAFPSSIELGARKIDFEELTWPCYWMDWNMNDRKWVAGVMSWVSAAMRPLLRLAWEGSAVMVLSAHYCLGYHVTGYLLSTVVFMYLVSQIIFVNICSAISDD